MKKLSAIIVTIFCVAAAIVLLLALTVLPSRLAFKGADGYCFYLGDTSENCREVRADGGNAAVLRLCLKDVCGESATYSELDAESFIKNLNGEVIFIEELEDSINYYCRANLPYSVSIYGKQINLHVCVKESGVTVASPIIFGGY